MQIYLFLFKQDDKTLKYFQETHISGDLILKNLNYFVMMLGTETWICCYKFMGRTLLW